MSDGKVQPTSTVLEINVLIMITLYSDKYCALASSMVHISSAILYTNKPYRINMRYTYLAQ